MAVAKNQKTGKWYSKVRYHDYTGRVIQKKKEGFTTRKEAVKWEKDFLSKNEGTEQITFKQAFEKYLEDMAKRLKPTSFDIKARAYANHYTELYNIPITAISADTVRQWQTAHLLATDPVNGKMKMSASSIRLYNSILVSFFNYCVKFFGLTQNPVVLAGAIKIRDDLTKQSEKSKKYWTKKEFDDFLATVKNPEHRLLFEILFYCGLRCAEAMGIKYKDFDAQNKTLHIRQALSRQKEITTTKTKSSVRDITLPDFLIKDFIEYKDKIYKPRDDDLLFHLSPAYVTMLFQRYITKSGVEKIRLHDLRHSHASMLIDAGFSPQAVADRLGHSNAAMVLKVYGHLYEKRRDEIAEALDKIHSA